MADIAILKSLSKELVRHPVASVSITWSDTSADATNIEIAVTPEPNRASLEQQVKNGLGEQKKWAFCETANPVDSMALLDSCYAMPDNDQQGKLVGWWASGLQVSDNNRNFAEPYPKLTMTFAPIPIANYELRGFLNLEWAEDFDLIFHFADGRVPYTHQVYGNTMAMRAETLPQQLDGVNAIDLIIKKWSCRGAFVKITAFLVVLDEGYGGDEIMTMNLLEETEGSFGTLPVGNISANSMDLVLQNLDDTYFFGNTASLLRNSARTNRRVEPTLGFKDKTTGITYTIPKGVYWTRDWEIADQGTDASTSAVDRLGLLQDVQYQGIGRVNNQDDANVPESVVRLNISLYDLAAEILTDLQNTYMNDLEFAIDTRLQNTIIPLAFFTAKSYFDVIKDIATAGAAYAYMDTPTDDEKETAAGRGNSRCMDILRIKPLEVFLNASVDESQAEEISLSDYIIKTTKMRQTDMANIVSVKWTPYMIDGDGKPKEDEDNVGIFTARNDSSILEFGKIAYEFDSNHLIQTRSHAVDIATRLRTAFSEAPYISEINMFGDVTRKVGDILLISEYQKHGINTQDYYAVTKVQTGFDGGIRQDITCRKVREGVVIEEMVGLQDFGIVNELPESQDTVDEQVGG